MDKAYDLKALAAKVNEALKSEGLPTMAEATLEKSVVVSLGATMDWLKESAEISTNPVDNFVVPLLDYVQDNVAEQAKKIIDLDGDGA